MVWKYKPHGLGKYRLRVMVYDEEYREIYKDTDVELYEGMANLVRFLKKKINFTMLDVANIMIHKDAIELNEMKKNTVV